MEDQAVDMTLNDSQVDQFFESGGELPEATEVTEQPEVKQEQDSRTVPLAALHEERARRKELSEQLKQLQEQSKGSSEKVQRMESLFQRMLEEREARSIPQYEENPLEHLRIQQERINQQIAGMAEQQHYSQQERQIYEQQARFLNSYKSAAAEFAQQTKDFQQAYSHLIQSRVQELQSIGYNPQEAATLAQQEEAMIVQKAFNDGANPAERLYSLAKMRGYSVAPTVTPEQKMETLAKGQEAAKSLSTAQSKASGDLTLEALADLDGEDFDKAWAKLIG